MRSNRKARLHTERDYYFWCMEMELCRFFGGVEQETRMRFIMDSIIDHLSRTMSPEKYKDQFDRQRARLEPSTRWRRKNMKGYHLREVVVSRNG